MFERPLRETRRSKPGFRFSQRDAVVIAICTLATAWLWGQVGSLSLLLFGVLIPFFLFCNVFRVRTRYELIWAVSFVLNAGAWQLADALSWQRLLGSQIAITALVIGAELRSSSYRGIGHSWIHTRTGPRNWIGGPK
jgi:hypothetical protein